MLCTKQTISASTAAGRTVTRHFRALSSIYPENKTYNMLGAHLSKTKDKKKLLIILAILVILLLAGILLLTKSV